MNWLKRKASREASLGAATTSPSDFAKAAEAVAASSPGRRWQSRCAPVTMHLSVQPSAFEDLLIGSGRRSAMPPAYAECCSATADLQCPPGSEVPPSAESGGTRSKSWQRRRVRRRRSCRTHRPLSPPCQPAAPTTCSPSMTIARRPALRLRTQPIRQVRPSIRIHDGFNVVHVMSDLDTLKEVQRRLFLHTDS